MCWTLRSTFLLILLYIYGSESIPKPDKLTVNLNIDEKESIPNHHHHPGNQGDRPGNQAIAEVGEKEKSWGDYLLEERPDVRDASRCVTVGGADPGSSCQFPFMYLGKSYYGCTLDSSYDGVPWCSTQVDSRGRHVVGKWGRCGHNCAPSGRSGWPSGPKKSQKFNFNLEKNLFNKKECGRENNDGGEIFDYVDYISDDGEIFDYVDYISGGELVPPHKYPWMVHMVGKRDDGEVHQCTGSLISDTLVLTALHCVKNRKSWRRATWGVKVGAANVLANQHQLIKPKTGLWPRQSRGAKHDIAILILERPVDLEHPNVGIICLPAKGKENDIKGRNGVAVGWGSQYNKTYPGHLKQVELKVASLDDLRPKQEQLFMFTEIDRIKGIPQDPCAGDSGGPLQYRENGHWTIAGVLKGRGFNCEERKFSDKFHGLGQWNKVLTHLDWIRCVMKDANNCNSMRRDW